MRTPIIAGNWKMHTTLDEALELGSEVRRLTSQVRSVEVVLIPPFPYLAPLGKRLEGSRIALGAQDLWPEPKGAFTGAVSAPMLASVGCRYALCGHSERRAIFGDGDALVNRKVKATLAAGLLPILCVGETRDERRAGQTNARIEAQLTGGLEGVSAEQAATMVVAYEPVWAIGTGDTATPGQAQDVHAFVREWLGRRFGDSVAQAMRIQYGGSVKADNVDELMACKDIDGALVGGASLVASSFARIVKFE
ncbi:MAG: triosephosphate isomerase [Myxococcales bacterium]